MSGSLRHLLSARFRDAFARAGFDAAHGEVAVSGKRELAQFQCNGAMPAAKAARRNPREVAEAIIAAAPLAPPEGTLSSAGPGFINISLSDEFLARHTATLAASDRLGHQIDAAPQRVVIDYGGPNAAKPMHVGHLRSAIIGDALKRLFRFLGHEVIGDIHMGDWGTQMGMLIFALSEQQPGLPYFDKTVSGPYPATSPVTIEDLQDLYPAISARCKDDETTKRACQQAVAELQAGRPGYVALWRHFVAISVEEMKADYRRLGVEFDLWYGESDYNDRIPGLVRSLVERGHAVLDQGATIIPVAEPDENKPMPPVILLKSDGAANYHTTDLATIQQRVNDIRADLVLYVVDKRQALHFEQLFRAARKTAIAGAARLEHLGFGTMNGNDGKPFKTRAGGVMRLKDLMSMMTAEAASQMAKTGVAAEYPESEREAIGTQVGIGALKYADLMNARTADYVFDVERFTRFEGNTGAYLMYAAVRVKSILRKAAERGFSAGNPVPPSGTGERELVLTLAALPDAIDAAASERMPHHLCAQAYALATAFSVFYNECHILSEPDEARRSSWLGLCQLTLRELELLLGLLGIEIPERM